MNSETGDAVAAYARHVIAERIAGGANYRVIAPEWGCSHVTVWQIHKKGKGVGRQIEQALADQLHGGSIDVLRAAARQYAREHPESVMRPAEDWSEFASRYPNGAAVYEQIKAALHPGVRGDAIRALHFPGDPPADVWRTNYFALSDLLRQRDASGALPSDGTDTEAAKLEAMHKPLKKRRERPAKQTSRKRIAS